MSVVNSVNPAESLMYLIRLISLLAIYLSIYNIIQVENDALKILRAVIYSSIIPVSLGFYQYIVGGGLLSPEFNFNRLNSTFIHPNVYAFYLITILFYIIFLYYLEKYITGESDLRFKIVLSILVLIQLVFTYSRGAWIGVMAGLLVVALFMKETRKWIVISSILFIIVFLPQILNRTTDLMGPSLKKYSMSSWTYRLELWHALLKNAFIHKPLLGYGLGQSVFAAKKYSLFTIIPHNDYLRILIELGVTGLIPFLLFWMYNLWNLFKRFKWEKTYPKLNTVLLGFLTALLVCSFADSIIYAISNAGYMFALLAVGHKLNFLNSVKAQMTK